VHRRERSKEKNYFLIAGALVMFFSFFVGNGLFSTIVQSVRVEQSKFLIKLDTINIENESITKWLDIWRRINEIGYRNR
jgi:hypothetical protein